MSELNQGRGSIKLNAHIVIRDPKGNITFEEDHPDISCNALLAFMQQNILAGVAGAAINIKDVTNTNRSINANTACSAPFVVAGVTATAVNFADYALGDGTTNTDYKTNSSYAEAATVAAITSNHFAVTGTITNSGSDTTYKEIGLAWTCAGYQFLGAHDLVNSGTGYLVSGGGGTLAITYTATGT